jgi:hypothetical protein
MQETLFQVAWQTLSQFASIAVSLGAKTGMIAVLHPHLHCIVPAGGVDDSGGWVWGKKTDNRSSFLFPVTQNVQDVPGEVSQSNVEKVEG